jgi:protochlorophyllide reductase
MTASAAQRTAIVTGASSGIGLYTAKALVEQGWHVILACRSYSKALKAARNEGMPDNTYTIMNLDLAALSSVREFAQQFKNSGRY